MKVKKNSKKTLKSNSKVVPLEILHRLKIRENLENRQNGSKFKTDEKIKKKACFKKVKITQKILLIHTEKFIQS